jgi:MoaA/NifB/PqqE/SkfB family radical SAM enzyme
MIIIREIFRPPPAILYLEPFFGCNYRCFFCIHGSGREIKQTQLEPHIFERIKPIVSTVEHVHLTGLGEPLLNPHILDYLVYFKEQGKSCYINTNGALLSEAHVDLLTTCKSELSVSLDAGDPETYGRMRHPRNWDRVIGNLKKAAGLRLARKSPYPRLYLTFHLNRRNLMSLQGVPELGRALGIDAVKISWTILPATYQSYSLFEEQDLAAEVIQSVSAQLRRLGIEVRCEATFAGHTRGCWNLTPMVFVGANGAVAACCNRWLTIGNLSDNSLEDIWNGLSRRQIVLAILNKEPQGRCETCPQIVGADYGRNDSDFLKPQDLEEGILAEKAKRVEKLPSLAGLDQAFRFGVEALLGGNLPEAVQLLGALAEKFPEFFEIKNNLAVAHYYLGNLEKCREILGELPKIPHNKRLLQDNLRALS